MLLPTALRSSFPSQGPPPSESWILSLAQKEFQGGAREAKLLSLLAF